MQGIAFVLEIIGTCAFAVSGSVAAMEQHLDIFGVLFCGIVTAVGGGTIRDMLLGNLPPVMFSNYVYLVFAAAGSLITFITAKILNKKFERNVKLIDRSNNIFDAAGLGIFTVSGINTAVACGFPGNGFLLVFLGMTTGCGGGILRDIILRKVPFVFTKRIYAVASLAGGLLYYLLMTFTSLPDTLCSAAGVVFIVLLRILASHFKWDLPKAY